MVACCAILNWVGRVWGFVMDRKNSKKRLPEASGQKYERANANSKAEAKRDVIFLEFETLH